MTAFELGSDIGGSIRTPAHFCGIYGHKPSYGIVPGLGHIPGPPGSQAETDMAVLGPMTRSAQDLPLLMDVLAGPTEQDAAAWSLALPPSRRTALREYRVAAWLSEPDFPVDGEVGEPLEAAVAALCQAGVKVNSEARPGFALADAFENYLRLLWPVMAAALPAASFNDLAAQGDRADTADPDLGQRMARYMTSRHRDWLQANEIRHKYRMMWRDFFRDYDVLLCPANPVCAFPHDQSQPQFDRTIVVNGHRRWYWEQLVWAGALAGMAYLPATVAPIGLSRTGLPVGVQIVGPYLEDRMTMDFAARLGELMGGFVAPVLAD
jgi:amidase